MLCAATAQAQSPEPRYSANWSFARHAQGWQLQAGAAEHAQARWLDGALQLQAAMYQDARGQLQCPVAAASRGFGDASTRGNRDEALRLVLEVRRWDLGLGPMDDHAPLLEVVHHGVRSLIPVQGFQTMPGQVTLLWQRALGWQISFGTAAPRPLQVRARPDTAQPSLKLWIDGCSQGMRQSLQLTRVSVSAW